MCFSISLNLLSHKYSKYKNKVIVIHDIKNLEEPCIKHFVCPLGRLFIAKRNFFVRKVLCCYLGIYTRKKWERRLHFLGNLMGYNVLCFYHRSVVSARVLYDDNPTVDLTQIQSALRNNRSTAVVYKQEKVVSPFAY
jgi:hypothetical protein